MTNLKNESNHYVIGCVPLHVQWVVVWGRDATYRNILDGEGVRAQDAVEDFVRLDVVDRHVQLAVGGLAALVAREPATEDHLTFPVLGELYYIQMVRLTKVLNSAMKKSLTKNPSVEKS